MNSKRTSFTLLFAIVLFARIANGQIGDTATSYTTLAPTVIFSGRGSVKAGPPAVVTTPAVYWNTDPNFGFAMGLNGNESWSATSIKVNGALNKISFSLSTPIHGISWAIGDCFQVHGLTAYGGYVAGLDSIDLAVSATTPGVGTSTVTLTISGTANSCQPGSVPGAPLSGTTNLTSSPVYAYHYSMFLAGNEVVFNRLVSSSKYCPNVGSIRLCNSSRSNSDKIFMLDPNTDNTFVALQRWTGRSGVTSWTQIGDPSYGAITPGGLSTPTLFDASGNNEIAFSSDRGTITDYLRVTNSNASDHTVIIQAAGSDTAISINLKPKGGGSILCDGSSCGGGGGEGGMAVSTSGRFGFSSTSAVSGAKDIALYRMGAGVTAFSSGGNSDQNGMLYGSGNVCKTTSAITLSTSATTVCLWTLPAVAKTWAFTCFIGYKLSAGTAPTFTLAMNASQTPTNETGFANIYSTNTGTSTQNSMSSTSSGTQNILTGGAVTTGTTYQATAFGTIQASATNGTFAIQALIGGQSSAGTVTVGSTCILN
jgi:hypothetical protein